MCTAPFGKKQVRSVPELMTLLRSMKEAARSVAAVSVRAASEAQQRSTLQWREHFACAHFASTGSGRGALLRTRRGDIQVLLWGNIYIFAIVFRLIWINGTHGEPGLFDNVTESMSREQSFFFLKYI